MPERSGSFSRNSATALHTGAKLGPNGTYLVSTGLADLDKVLGGGIPLGGIVMIMEDIESPHHLLLLRFFMAQGLVHDQSLLFASPLASPQGFLGTLPNVLRTKDTTSDFEDPSKQGEGLRIAWQYRKYFTDNQSVEGNKYQQLDHGSLSQSMKSTGAKGYEFCNTFDLRKPIEKSILNKANVKCLNLETIAEIPMLKEQCASFLSNFPRAQGNHSQICRIAIQSLSAPQCNHFQLDWEMLSFLKSLRSLLRASNAVAMVTFAPSLLAPSFSTRWKHLSDILLSVKAISDDDEELAKLLTDYKDIIGFLHVHKLARINTQVPTILDATTYSLKLRKRMVSLEHLNQAPVNPTSGESYSTSAASSLCSKSSNHSLDF